MTAIQGFIKPSRRPGELGIHSLDHFHFAVPDLVAAKNFYSEFGLNVGEKGNLLTLNTFEHPHTWGTIGEGPRKKFGYVSFGAFEDDMERFSERLQTMGIKRLDPPHGIELQRPYGSAITTASWWKSKLRRNRRRMKQLLFSFSHRRPESAERHSAARRRVHAPGDSAHVLMFTRDVRKAIEF